MSLSVGIVGLPNVGKSTLFNALTRNSVPAENYPFCTIDPSVGIVPVPDQRLAILTSLSRSKKTIPAIVEFVDIAGLVAGAASGEGLGNKFLSHIKEVDMIAEVVRIFEDGGVTHVSGTIDPLRDISVINLELILADLETVTKRLGTIERDQKRGEFRALQEGKMLLRIKEALVSEKLANSVSVSKEEEQYFFDLRLLTAKPFLYVLNKKSGGVNLDEIKDGRWTALMEFLETQGSEYVVVDAGVESELRDLTDEEKHEFRKEYGADHRGITSLIVAAYKLLGRMSYFTTGEAETRAWTVRIGASAPEAGKAIHSDFEQKFIRAQVVSYTDLEAAGSMALARAQGKVRTEGKEYTVKEGDVIEFLI